MRKNQLGATLLEVTISMLIVLLCYAFITFSTNLVRITKLRMSGEEVRMAISFTRRAAVLTKLPYTMILLDNRIIIKQGEQNTVDKIYLKDTVYIPPYKAGEVITFNGTIAPKYRATTIVLRDSSINKQIRLTIGVATGKIRVYEENII